MQQVFKCPKCGKQCDPSSQFCGGCGTRLFVGDQQQAYQNQQIYSCPGCGQTVTYGGRFCKNCGAQLNWTAQYTYQPPPYYQPQPAYTPQVPVPQKRGSSQWTIIGVLIAVLVIAGGIFTFIKMNNGSISLPSLPLSNQSAPDTIQLPWGSTIDVVFNGPPELDIEWEKLGMADSMGSQIQVIGNVKNVSSQPVRFTDVNYYLDGYQVAFTNYGPEGQTLYPGETIKIMKGFPGFTEYTKVLEIRIIGFQKLGGAASSLEPTTQPDVTSSSEGTKKLPSQVTIDTNIDPNIEVWQITMEPPLIEEGRIWVVKGDIDNGSWYGWDKYAPKITIEFNIEFNKGIGELSIPITIERTMLATGNPIVQTLDLDGWDSSFTITYPLEATSCNVRIVRIR